MGAGLTADKNVGELSSRFRRCVGLYPTGVAIVTCAGRGDPAGMTINSFISVSVDPLLVLVSVHARSRTLRAMRSYRRFAISLLRENQVEVAKAFSALRAPFPTELVDQVDGDVYVVPDALAVLDCEATEFIEAGDHVLVLARVRSFEHEEGEPLLFFRGEFGTLAPILDADLPRPLSPAASGCGDDVASATGSNE
jgi:flavin reductase (DIM6/NTAB) family NADH-FMN oxidoreductase RutF